MTKKKAAKSLTVLFGDTRTRKLNGEREVIDNREWWHYKIHGGGKKGRIADGMDGVIVSAAGSRIPGDVCWPDVQANPKAVRSIIGPRGLKFLQSLMKQKGFPAIEELHIVSAWQIKILVARERWSNPDRLVLPALKTVLGKKLAVEKWSLPDSEVTVQ